MDELHWNSRGQLIDADKRIVECMKNMGWETALEQLRERVSNALIPIRTGHPEGGSLADVLYVLNTVFELFGHLFQVIKQFYLSYGNCSLITLIC